MKIYLAARYSRRLELCDYRRELERAGFTVQAGWLNGNHQIDDAGKPIGETGESIVEADGESTEVKAKALREHFAAEDLGDVMACDLLIAFTEPPRSGNSRGGRHVEFGIALGLSKGVCVVGPRENIFHWLPDLPRFETFGECLSTLISIRTAFATYFGQLQRASP